MTTSFASILRGFSIVIATAASLAAASPAAGATEIAQHFFRIPGTDYEIVLDQAPSEPRDVLMRPLLAAISTWLSRELDLPAVQQYPKVELASAAAITALRYKRLVPAAPREPAAEAAPPRVGETVAIYSDDAQTIYLTEGWSGDTPADLSVVVHEMVHHFQNVLGLKHDCPQEREKLAYRAQERWLALFGHSLESDFELDGFSLLGKTRCFF